ncbi:unnamed protein product [Nippostrongylus brasiliensis]|uniref:Secreted protein n=1 Tax=Nippostrongylus brasiliensis TaxID=27835 RepID=A0A0N4YBY7_NIPBR|nr:hypothetical protein Q1695_005627 [Nippostrongylus brasiliensis]VDL77612.1 unnamed protein product [Nippostrongylus brasiliensis]
MRLLVVVLAALLAAVSHAAPVPALEDVVADIAKTDVDRVRNLAKQSKEVVVKVGEKLGGAAEAVAKIAEPLKSFAYTAASAALTTLGANNPENVPGSDNNHGNY